MAKAILLDLTKCIGCRACQAACKQWNDLPAETTRNIGSYENPPRRSAKTWTTVSFNEVSEGDNFHWVFAKRQCMHCEHPACASACIVGALQKSSEGPVTYDGLKCIGCRYCMLACPFSVPTFEWDRPVPFIRKCTLCQDRLSRGMAPVCATVCSTNAIIFGEREGLLEEARLRIRTGNAKYVNHIYGEKEAGGTSWLYISTLPVENMGFPSLDSRPMNLNANRAMSVVPPVLLGVAAAMSGIYWLNNRRDNVKQGNGGFKKGKENN